MGYAFGGCLKAAQRKGVVMAVAHKVTKQEQYQELVGSFHKIGDLGPVYEVLEIVDDSSAIIIILESGEKLEYPLASILKDPEA